MVCMLGIILLTSATNQGRSAALLNHHVRLVEAGEPAMVDPPAIWSKAMVSQ